MIFKTNSAKETIALGQRLGEILDGKNAVILLDGDLAAGKTTFTKGIALGLGIKNVIKSPTFTIMKEYKGEKNKLYHLDLYRLSEMGNDFDLEEYIDDVNSVVVIEWPFQVNELLPEDYIMINITGNNHERVIEFTENGKYKKVLESL